MPSPSPRRRPPRLRLPVIILAGGADGQDAGANAAARRLLLAGFSRFSGLLISGGTTSGIAGVAGAIAARHPQVRAIGYLPEGLPPGAERDRRYAEFRTTPASHFSAAEALAYWADLLAAGVPPAAVKLLGWGGGQIAAAEYRIALALGAQVGLVRGSGRSAEVMALDPFWAGAPHLRVVAATAAALRGFLSSPP